MDYLTLKFLHVTGACLFVGNNLVTPLWKSLADRTRDARVIAFAQRLVTVTDLVFTLGGVLLLLGAGQTMLAKTPGLGRQHWVHLGYAGFVGSGLIWLLVLVPTQRKQAKLAREMTQTGAVPDAYWTLARRWMIAGSVASLLPLLSLFAMVTKL